MPKAFGTETEPCRKFPVARTATIGALDRRDLPKNTSISLDSRPPHSSFPRAAHVAVYDVQVPSHLPLLIALRSGRCVVLQKPINRLLDAVGLATVNRLPPNPPVCLRVSGATRETYPSTLCTVHKPYYSTHSGTVCTTEHATAIRA